MLTFHVRTRGRLGTRVLLPLAATGCHFEGLERRFVQKREKGEEEEGEGESERAEEAKRAKESDRGERKARVTQRV